MADVAAPEAPVVEVPVVEVPQEPVVTPEPVVSPEGEAPQEPAERIDLREILKTATPAELRALMDSAPEESRAAVEQEIEGRGEQRAQTRKKEVDTATSERLSAWKPYVDNLPNAQAYVNGQLAKLKAGEFLDNPTLFEQASQQLNVGTLGKVVLENEAYVPGLVEEYLPELTKEEAALLDKPMYKFGQTGMAKEAVAAIFKVAVARARTEAFAEGVKKGEGNLTAQESLVEKLTKATLIRKEGAGVGINGSSAPNDNRATIQRDIAQLKQDINTGSITQAQYAERDQDIQRRISALPKE